MKICLISGEIFAWGKYGGFGRATRAIGSQLVQRGYEVCAVVPRREGQRPIETLDGIQVFSFPRHNPLAAIRLCRDCDADIYHSQQPSLGTVLAMLGQPKKRHVITCRDTKIQYDWDVEMSMPSRSKWSTFLSRVYEDNPLVRLAVRRAEHVYCAYHGTGQKAQAKFNLSDLPDFLPTPVRVPDHVSKSKTPTVCYVGRWDRRKRPQLYFELARQFPDVRFVAVGSSQDKAWDQHLRDEYASVPNLEMKGFVNQFESDDLSKVLSESWVLVNTAAREGLPNAFLEAAAHRCAILSMVDPDGFTTRYGHRVHNGDIGDGLRYLLEGDRWQQYGRRGFEYVQEHYESSQAMDQHCEIYEKSTSAS